MLTGLKKIHLVSSTQRSWMVHYGCSLDVILIKKQLL